MSEFKQEYVDLRLHKDGIIRTTQSELHYYSEILNEWIIVPIGFKTDLGSIPVGFQWLFPRDGKAVLGYIIHDYLYKTGKYSRSKSDDILKEAMNVLGTKKWRQNGVRFGLRIGGWYAWNKHRKNDKES